MPRTVIVTGIAGVGKTTVLNELKNLAQETKVKVSIVNFGTIMNEILRELGKDMHRDEIRKQEVDMQRKVQEMAANEITNRFDGGVVLVDTHMFVRTEEGLWAGLPSSVLAKLKPSLLVLIETDAEEIMDRRTQDQSRMRDKALADEISFELAWSRSTASACSVLTGAPVKIIRNDSGMHKEAAKTLLQIIRSYGG